uniref:VWFA domain-containing protein n=1 Tax=Caenorhabditis tropicalis TaxID=1561998 RepID=A0A1I7TJJ3_9PELO
MSGQREVFIFVDSSLKMHVKIDHKRTAISKVYKFLLYLARKGDSQPCYFEKIHIRVGDEYIRIEENQAEKNIREAQSLFKEPSAELDHLSVWKTELARNTEENSLFFIASSVIDQRLIDMFQMHRKKLLFLDFSGKKVKLRKECRGRVQIIKYKDVMRAARIIHRKLLSNYLTKVNLGFSIRSKFIIAPVADSAGFDLESIDIVGMTTYEPVESNAILTTSYLLPVDTCYDSKNSKCDSATGYRVLRVLLGEDKSILVEDGESKDTTRNESLNESLDDSRNESRNLLTDKEEVIIDEANVSDQKEAEVKVEVKEEEVEEEEEEQVVSTKSTPKKSPRKKKQVYKSLEEDDDDEEYTPKKKKGGRKGARGGGTAGRGGTPGRGGKRKRVQDDDDEEEPQPTKRATRRSTRGRKSDPVTEEEPEEKEEEPPAAEPVETTEEPSTEPAQEPQTSEQGEGEKKEEEKKDDEPPLPKWLLARGKDRRTGIYRPVILRLRGPDDDDKTYYDEETLKLKEEEASKKKLEEEAEEAKKLEERKAELEREAAPSAVFQRQEMPQFQQPVKEEVMEDESPESPPPDDCPASPDMKPTISQPVRIIPTTTIPLEPEPTTSKDVDYRQNPQNVPIKAIPLEPVEVKVDMDYRDIKQEVVPAADAPSNNAEPGELVDSDFDDGDELGELVDEEDGSDIDVPMGIDSEELHEMVDEYNAADDDPDVPEEPSEENLVPVQQEPVKNIPIESCIETEDVGENTIDETVSDKLPAERRVDGAKQTDPEKNAGSKYIQVIVLNMTWEEFETQIVIGDDDETAEEVNEREQLVVGEEPFHDYTKLTGWYSDEAMQFYINKMFRALRKLNERSHLFETEYRHMTQMIIHGQNPELARAFAMLMVDDIEIYPDETIEIAEQASQHFEQMYNQMAPVRPRRQVLPPEPARYQEHHRMQHQGHPIHHGHPIHPGHVNRQMYPHPQNYHQPHHQRYQRTPQKQHHGHYPPHHQRY